MPKQYGNKMLIHRLFSPNLNGNEIKWMFSVDKMLEANSKIFEALMTEGRLSMYDYSLNYDMSIIIIMKDQDWITPFSMVLNYFNASSASSSQ